jgi:hypothetical protein
MSNFTFSMIVPNAPNNPSNDQSPMLVNNISTAGWAAVDHLGYNTNNGGYHNVAHWNNQGSDPGLTGGFGQLYTKTITANSIANNQLFYQATTQIGSTGFGPITQLTGPVQPSIGVTAGYTTLPGGLIMQWFLLTPSSSGSGTNFLFASIGGITFPNNIFGGLSSAYSTGATAGGTISISNASTSGFTSKSSSGGTIFFVFIGN